MSNPGRYAGLKGNDDTGILLPSQFVDERRSAMGDQGLRRLMIALLEDSVDVLQNLGKGGLKGRIAAESRDWIFNSDPRDRFSFDGACEVAGIEAVYFRLGLARYIERLQANPARAFHRNHNNGKSVNFMRAASSSRR